MASPYDFSGMSQFGLTLPGSTNLAAMNGGQGLLAQPSAIGGGFTPLAPNQGFGFNMPTAQFGLSALQGLGNLWGAFQANKLARDQFNFQKGVTETNIGNQIKSYNTALEDRARTRAFTEGRSAADAEAYIDKNRLTR